MPIEMRPGREEASPPGVGRAIAAPGAASARSLTVGRIVVLAISTAMVAVLGRVWHLQTSPPSAVAQLLDSQHSRSRLLGRRGNITDRQGRLIATTRVATRLFVDPLLVVEPQTFSEKVGYKLGYDPAWVEKTIAERINSRYVVIDHRMDDRKLHALRQLELPGLSSEPTLVRDYPMGAVAGQIVGFVGRDGVGLEGVEHELDRKLIGEAGRIRYWRDARKEPLMVDRAGYSAPQDGNSVRLSIDLIIQSIAEEALAAACKEFEAKSGQIVIMHPRTGEILAMANVPTFDPNRFGESTVDERRNRCVTDAFEPGSTFKPFVWAAATDAGVAHPTERIDCTSSGAYRFSFGRTLRDAHPVGHVDWDTVLIKSSNIGMGIVGMRLGANRMWQAVNSFGFGSPTGSQLPGESPGILNPLKKWTMYSVTSVPMGQEIAVTPLQLARAFCAFANGGLLVHPTIRAKSAEDIQRESIIQERVISQSAADHTRQVLRRAVVEGTGRKADSKLYDVFGKTGTAQVPDRVKGGYIPDHYTGVFVCGAPYDDPAIVMAVVIHSPNKKKGYYGGIIAAPTAMRVIEQTLPYLGIAPKEPATPPSRQAVVRR